MARFQISSDDMGLASVALPASVTSSLMYDGTHINGSDEAVAMVEALNFTDLRKASLLDYVALKRWQVETSGIQIGGITVRSDRESQSLINGAYNMALRNENFTVKFKTDNGFVDLNAAQIIAIAEAVAMHVQLCFANEAMAVQEINSGNFTTKAHVDAALAV